MKLFRTMLLTAGLLMFAQTASAQCLSLMSLQALNAARQHQVTVTWVQQDPLCAGAAMTCPLSQCSWLNNLVQQSMTGWQRLNAVCGYREASCAAPVCCAKGGSAVEAQKCCCAKACACCETCATPKAARYDSSTYPKQAFEPCPATSRSVQCPAAPPAPPVWAPMPQTVWQAQPASTPRIIAVPSAPVSYQVVRSVPTAAAQAHLVTADFDIHCERMTHKGDLIMLEGNVRLVCLKLGRHMLVEAQRVMFNVRDGSFTVENDARPTPAGAFGVLRMSAVEATHPGMTVIAVPVQSMQPAAPARQAVPTPINWQQGFGRPGPNW